MQRRLASTMLAVLLVLAAAARGDLRAEVDRAIVASGLAPASVSVSVRDASTGSSLVGVLDTTPRIPASNMKLVTSGVALHVLGPDYRFATRLLRDGDRLVVVGDGDPAFGDPALLRLMEREDGTGLSVEEFLALWVDAVVASGMEGVSEIVVDDRIFDRVFTHPGWPADQLNRHYCAQVAGLNFHANVLHAFPRPTSSGRPDLSRFDPRASWLHPTNRATSRQGRDDGNTIWAARIPGTNRLTFYGNVKTRYAEPMRVTVDAMPDFFAKLLRTRLERAGVPVGRARVAGLGEPPVTADPVGPIVATPMSTVVTRCNTNSHNLYAEALLKRVAAEVTGEPGSWEAGGAAVRRVVHDRLGSQLLHGLIVSDGSGLSRENRVTAAMLTAWLGSMRRDERLADVYVNSLAVAGESGTLRRRFGGIDLHGAEVRAKSGFINGVSCLSGYVIAPDGRCLCFSVLANDLNKPGAVTLAKRLQERVASAAAQDLAAVRTSLGSD